MHDFLLSTIIPLVVSSLVAYWVAHYSLKKESYFTLQADLNSIIDLAIEHPHFEDELYTSTWDHSLSKENNETIRNKSIQYESYVTRVFNHLERHGNFYSWFPSSIEKDLDVEEWVKTHIVYWGKRGLYKHSESGYCLELKNLINRYMNRWGMRFNPETGVPENIK